VHRFESVMSYEYDLNNENDDLDSDEPNVTITNAGCKSIDFEMRFGKHIPFNSHNLLRFEFYAGLRFGQTYGTRNGIIILVRFRKNDILNHPSIQRF